MRAIFSSALLLLFSLSIFAQDGKITGTVTYETGLAIHDASVQLLRENRTTTTDAEGRFEFNGLRPGRYSVLVHVDGFADTTRAVVVNGSEASDVDFRLSIASLNEQVTVTASGTEQSVLDSFQTVSVVGTTAITERASTSIGEVLDGEPGVAKRSFGPGSSRPVIRGFDGDRVLVLQDGIRTGSLGSQSGDHGEPIDPLGSERIEVVKGPATLLYGSNAIGGVVNVLEHHDNNFHPGFRGRATVLGGTADRQRAFAGGVEYGFEKFMIGADLGLQRIGNYDSPEGRIDNSRSRSNSGGINGGYFGNKAWLRGSFSSDIFRYGVPFAGEFHGHHDHDEHRSLLLGEQEEDEEELDVDIRLRTYNYRVSGGFRGIDTPVISDIQYSLNYTDYRHKEIEILHHDHDHAAADEHVEEEVATTFANKIVSYRTLFEQTKNKQLTGRFGFEGFSREFLVNGEEQLINGPVKHNSISAYILEELNFERVKLQFGGRLENNRYKVSDPALRDRSFTGFSGGVGLNVGLWKEGSLIFNYSHSSRAPSLEELYNNGPHIGNLIFEEGNNDLERETANGLDIALRHSSQKVRFSGDLYYYRINNFVFLEIEEEHEHEHRPFRNRMLSGLLGEEEHFELPIGEYKQGDASYWGAEFSAEADLHKNIGGFISFDMVRAKLLDHGTNAPRIPPARFRMGLDLKYRGLSVRPEAVFAAKQDRVFEHETPTDGYGLFNIAGSYVIGQKHFAHVFSVNGYNLTNKLYRNHVSFIKDLVPEVGRGFRFGYTIRFF